MNMAAKVAAGSILALIGLMVVKMILGLIGVVTGLLFFVLFRVLPIVLLVWFGIWLMRKIFGTNSGTTTTT